MAAAALHASLARVFQRRCFYLFGALLVLVVAVPFVFGLQGGRTALQLAHALVLVAALAAVGRGAIVFVAGLLLAMSALALQLTSFFRNDPTQHIMLASALYVAFYLLTIASLLRYVFNPQVMTADKLFGAAAGYLLLGILWADIYRLVQYMDPEAFGGGAGSPLRSYYDLVYMSFGCLTSNGAGDIVPMGSRVRSLVILEQLTGTLLVAILIARLAGIYPAPENAKAADSSR